MKNKEQVYILKSIKKIIAMVAAYFIAGLLFVSTGGAWISDESLTLSQDQVNWWLFCITISIVLVLFLFNYEKKLQVHSNVKYKILIAFFCMITYWGVCNGNISEYYIYFVMLILWLSVFLLQTDVRIIWNAFINIAIFIAGVSLFFYILGTCLKAIPETGVTSLQWGVWDTSSIRSFFNIYYESQFLTINETIAVPRNCGIFSEAPMYNFVLCVALGAEVFVTSHVHYWKVILLSVTIMTTLSTTGYLFLILVVVFYLANIIFSQKGLSIHKIAYGFLMLFGGIIVIGIIIQKSLSISGASSVNIRMDHLLACIKAWLSSLMVGVGFQNQEAVLAFAEYKQGMSIGLLYMFATGGILLSAVIIIPYLLNVIDAIKNRIFDEVIFESLFLILYFFTAVTSYSLLRYFIAYIIVINLGQPQISSRIDICSNKLQVVMNSKNYTIDDYLLYIKPKRKFIFLISLLIAAMVCAYLSIKHKGTGVLVLVYGVLTGIGILLFLLLINYLRYLIRGYSGKSK